MRWHQLGAFYPFSRNYNSFNSIDQDPAVFIDRGHPEVTDDIRRVLNIRYSLLPYLYTLFYISHTRGNTVFRPLFHEFPTDSNTWGIDTQFLWGPDILFSPFLFENQTKAEIYIPDDVWYDFYTFKKQKTGLIDITTAPGIHMRGGSIIPFQKPGNNSKDSEKISINLYVFPKNNEARGLNY
jgi:alpha-glucosidase (family GH31 glycosyl hydrolase)